MSGHERYEELMMRAVDGLIDDAERAELDKHLEGCAECRDELRDFTQIKESTDALRERIMADAKIEPLGAGASWMAASWVLMLTGTVTLLGFAALAFLRDPEVPTLVKAAAGTVAAGGFGIFAYALRSRLRGLRHDPYREIDR